MPKINFKEEFRGRSLNKKTNEQGGSKRIIAGKHGIDGAVCRKSAENNADVRCFY